MTVNLFVKTDKRKIPFLSGVFEEKAQFQSVQSGSYPYKAITGKVYSIHFLAEPKDVMGLAIGDSAAIMNGDSLFLDGYVDGIMPEDGYYRVYLQPKNA